MNSTPLNAAALSHPFTYNHASPRRSTVVDSIVCIHQVRDHVSCGKADATLRNSPDITLASATASEPRDATIKRHQKNSSNNSPTCNFPLKGRNGKPKRPRTAYNLFFRDTQADLQGTDRRTFNVAAVVSSRWQKISAPVRLHYNQMAAADKVRYYNEKNEYEQAQQNMDDEQATQKEVKKQEQKLQQLQQKQQCAQAENETIASKSKILQSPRVGNDYYDMVSLMQEPILAAQVQQQQQQQQVVAEETMNDAMATWVPPFSPESIAFLATKLDNACISFLIKALK